MFIYFCQEITKVGDELGIVPVIIRGEELNQRGFGGKFVGIEEVVLSQCKLNANLYSFELPHTNNIA